MKPRAVALIDGEHYPSVTADALRLAGERYEVQAAVFLGGTEKIRSEDLERQARELYGLPVIFDTHASRGLARAISEHAPEVIIDLSDEPVLGYEQRFRLISESLARNVSYVGPDFQFSPASLTRLCTSPSLSVIGTGKRVGKTAISGYVARAVKRVFTGRGEGPEVVIVAMGRGGPREPEVVDGARARLTVRDLLDWSRQGRHAASDHFEDALLSGVVTVGCRRCGGGMAGQPFMSTVAEGVRMANSLCPGFIVLEGSGAALPPVASDARLLVAGVHQRVDHVAGLLGTYRLLVSDALVLTMAEEPLAPAAKVGAVMKAVEEIRPDIPKVRVVFRPRPIESVEGKSAAFFCTADPIQAGELCRYLEESSGCKVKLVSCNLADRTALRRDLDELRVSGVEVVLTEIKAAAIDLVAEEAEALGMPVVPVDNQPVEAGGETPGRLAELVEELVHKAALRFESGDRGE